MQFEGKVQRIARVHHYGLRDRVKKGGPEVVYTRRELLGYSKDFENQLIDTIISALSG